LWLTTISTIKYCNQTSAMHSSTSTNKQLSIGSIKTYHATAVQSLRKRLQVVLGAIVRVHVIKILLPVAMVSLSVSSGTLNVLRHGGDPDRVKTHTLNVVEPVDDAGPGAAAVLARCCVASGSRAAIGTSKAVSEQLVDTAAAPFGWTGGEGGGLEKSQAQSAQDRARKHPS
jgi:hypothetical protein